jgi:hypothetical protein
LLAGCANISGLDGLDTAQDLGDAGPIVDGAPADVTGDTKADAPTIDAPIDAPPVCQKTETDCTDGIDNDCNGKTDCQEASCTSSGYACTQEVASAQFGWYAASSKPACPGTSVATDLVTSIGPVSASCACSCTGQTTCPATASVENDENASCTAINNTRTLTLDNGCHGAGFDIQVAAKSAPLAPTTNTCSAKAALPALTTTTGRICKSQLPKGGGGCGVGLACLPVTPVASFKACMIMPSAGVCPASWPNASTVGTSVTDTRSCGACGCNATGSCTGTASFYTDGACATLKASIALGSCVSTGVGATTVGSYKAGTTATAACTNNSPTVAISGSASFSGQLALCCAN